MIIIKMQEGNNFFKKLPGKLPRGLIIRSMELICRIDALIAKVVQSKVDSPGLKEVQNLHEGFSDFIEDQSTFADFPFGKTSLAYGGCGIIAVHNCLHAMNEHVELDGLIRDFEKDGMLHGGKLGISPVAIRRYLQKKNCMVKVTRDPEKESAEGIICTVMNDRNDITKQLHIFYAEKTAQGYRPHNMGGKSRLYQTVEEMIKSIGDGRAKLLYAIAVRKEDKNGKNS